MAKVKAKVLCFIDNHLRQEGEVFEYSGVRNTNLEYLDAEIVEAGKEEQPVRKLRRPKASTDAME
jgi:hypothetical protein